MSAAVLHHRYWREDVYAARTVENRLRYIKKWATEGKQPRWLPASIRSTILCRSLTRWR